MFNYLKQIFNSRDLRSKILFTLMIIVIYRIMAQITVPGVNLEAVRLLANQNELLAVFSMLTGGSTENFSIVLMGISPYINASIIIQLLTVVVPQLESISKEGEEGKRKLNSYTRWLTLPLAFLQAYGMIVLLNTQTQLPLLENINDPLTVLPIMLTITTGTVLLVWLGELIAEKGIGNGISMIIFAGIIAQIPQYLGQGLFLATEDENKVIPFVATTLVTIILITIVILVTEAQRRIPITYANQGANKSEQSYLPVKINQAGMIPIIFAVSLISFPGILGQFLVRATSPWLQNVGSQLTSIFIPGTTLYLIIYFILVIAFTYFYVSITFNPEQVAENIQKRGGYIPGIRPGKQTVEYLDAVSRRLTLFGSIFLALIAILPLVMDFIFSTSSVGAIPLLISGAGIIIIVGVVLDLIRQINAQMVMHDYKKLY